MSAGAIIVIAVAASGVLMMRFRKRWLAKINIIFTNRITGLFAGWLPGFGILTHVGRKSGKVYRTPINVFRALGFAILIGGEVNWVIENEDKKNAAFEAKKRHVVQQMKAA